MMDAPNSHIGSERPGLTITQQQQQQQQQPSQSKSVLQRSSNMRPQPSTKDMPWNVVKDLSNHSSNSSTHAGKGTWASPRGRGKLMVHHRQGSPGPSTALTQIYSPPSHAMPSTSQGIVVQALSLVSDNPASHFSSEEISNAACTSAEPNLKKVSKRRRKANGEVDVEHTKSNNEFLRKIQQSLRDSQGESSCSEEERPESSSSEEFSSSGTDWNSSHGHNLKDLDASSHTAKTVSSAYNSDTSSSLLRARATLASPSSQSDSNSNSNPYGYEDPDKVIAPIQARRIPRIARRRGSVTEHTIRAARKAAAFAAAEQAAAQRRQTMPHTAVDAIAMAAAAAQRLQNIQGTSHRTLQHFQSRLQSGRRTTTTMMSNMGSDVSRATTGMTVHPPTSGITPSPSSNPYGYEDTDMPMKDTATTAASCRDTQESTCNPYGYEDADARAPPPSATENLYGYEDPDASNSNNNDNPYGYGDSAPSAYQATMRPRTRPRPRRRGSVTKYSFGAAQSVAAVTENDDSHNGVALASANSSDDYKPVIPARTFYPARNNSKLSPKQALQAPTRKLSPFQTDTSSRVSRKAALLSRTAAVIGVPGAPPVHAPPSRTSSMESFRTNRSNDMPYDSDDEDDSIVSSSSDELSLDDSFTSVTLPLKDESSSNHNNKKRRDGPARPPSRHDSMRSHASLDSTNHSVRTFDSDNGDSLAPELKSRCSISQHERLASGSSHGGLPTMLPQTPPPRSLSRKFISPHLPTRCNTTGKSKQAAAAAPASLSVERQASNGGLSIPPPPATMTMTFVETSPLATPKMHTRHNGLHSDGTAPSISLLKGEMLHQPELPHDETRFNPEDW